MERMFLEASPTTPRIEFDPAKGFFQISGKSLPENSFEFYRPVIEWIEAYVLESNPDTTLVFNLEYFNTSSTSHFLRLIKKLEKIALTNATARVKWYYDEEDEDMREAGEDFKLLSKIPIDILVLPV